MNKNKLLKLSGNISGLNKTLKILSFISGLVRILTAAVIVFTAADSFMTLKKA